MTVTAILSALAQEQEGLVAQLVRPVKVSRAGRDFWQGELHGHRVVLALSKIGKVAAATTATTLIEALGVRRIVFTGVAGGVGPGVQVGDVVVATDFVQHDMNASPLFPRYEIPLYGQTRFVCDPTLTAQLQHAATVALVAMSGQTPAETGHTVPIVGRVHSGLIASGDQFVASAAGARQLLTDLQAAGYAPQAVEMEGAAVAQVCFDYGVPFAAIRTVSDRADDSAHVDFPKFVTEVASHYARTIINEWMRQLPPATGLVGQAL